MPVAPHLCARCDALAAHLRAVQLAYVRLETVYREADRVGRFGCYWQEVAAVLYPTEEQSRKTDALDELLKACLALAVVSAQGDGSQEFDGVIAAFAGVVVEAYRVYAEGAPPPTVVALDPEDEEQAFDPEMRQAIATAQSLALFGSDRQT
jgi:hypothetical protein